MRSFQREVGNSKGSSIYKPLGITRTVGGSSSIAYGERGGHIGVEGIGERRRAEPRKLSQDEWQER